MAKAVVARQQGDKYQARLFWREAARLFIPSRKVVRVGYEVEDAGGFDDVAVEYDPPIRGEHGEPLKGDFYQVKFHVDHNGAVAWEAMMDPAFVGRKKESLLQRLHAAQKAFAPEGEGYRFYFVTTWGFDPNDPLKGLIDNGGGIRMEKLFDGTTDRSVMGAIRKNWREHLQLRSDEELQVVLRPLRILASFSGLDRLGDEMAIALHSAGLVPPEADERTSRYEVLIEKLHEEGRTWFTKEDLHEICDEEGLIAGEPEECDPALHVGVRSFLQGTEHLEDSADVLVCLLRHFQGRYVVDPSLWATTIFPSLQNALQGAAATERLLHLHLATHTSLAFAAGAALDPKQGARIAVVQHLRSGKRVWNPSANHDGNFEGLWTWGQVPVHGEGRDVALAVSVTHDVLQDVEDYVQRELPQVGRILSASVVPQPHSTSVRNGTHALKLAQSLTRWLRVTRTIEERRGRLHLFMAAPNAFACFLGQHARALGPLILYEYDFDTGSPGAYSPSLAFPTSVENEVGRSPSP
jgi:hypothetical protein